MGEERSADNPNAVYMQRGTVESYIELLRRVAVGLQRFDDDGRAPDAINCINAAMETLKSAPYRSDKLLSKDAEETFPPVVADVDGDYDESHGTVTVFHGAEVFTFDENRDVFIKKAATSPGVDHEGNPLPPFSEPQLPTDRSAANQW